MKYGKERKFMFCMKCGNKLEDDSKFCTACGASVKGNGDIKVKQDYAGLDRIVSARYGE